VATLADWWVEAMVCEWETWTVDGRVVMMMAAWVATLADWWVDGMVCEWDEMLLGELALLARPTKLILSVGNWAPCLENSL